MGFHIFGANKNEKNWKKNDEIGHVLVSGALGDTKKLRKTAADIFAKSGPEKPKKNKEQSKLSPDLFLTFPVDLA